MDRSFLGLRCGRPFTEALPIEVKGLLGTETASLQDLRGVGLEGEACGLEPPYGGGPAGPGQAHRSAACGRCSEACLAQRSNFPKGTPAARRENWLSARGFKRAVGGFRSSIKSNAKQKLPRPFGRESLFQNPSGPDDMRVRAGHLQGKSFGGSVRAVRRVRGSPKDFCPQGASTPKRVLRTIQRGVLGAALRFLQAGTVPRCKNRLSARENAAGEGISVLRMQAEMGSPWRLLTGGCRSGRCSPR